MSLNDLLFRFRLDLVSKDATHNFMYINTTQKISLQTKRKLDICPSNQNHQIPSPTIASLAKVHLAIY